MGGAIIVIVWDGTTATWWGICFRTPPDNGGIDVRI